MKYVVLTKKNGLKNSEEFLNQNCNEDDLKLDEERILNSLKAAENDEKYDHTEVWKILEEKD